MSSAIEAAGIMLVAHLFSMCCYSAYLNTCQMTRTTVPLKGKRESMIHLGCIRR